MHAWQAHMDEFDDVTFNFFNRCCKQICKCNIRIRDKNCLHISWLAPEPSYEFADVWNFIWSMSTDTYDKSRKCGFTQHCEY